MYTYCVYLYTTYIGIDDRLNLLSLPPEMVLISELPMTRIGVFSKA